MPFQCFNKDPIFKEQGFILSHSLKGFSPWPHGLQLWLVGVAQGIVVGRQGEQFTSE